jgi:hypothetical protein
MALSRLGLKKPLLCVLSPCPRADATTSGGANGSFFARSGFVDSHPFRKVRGIDEALALLAQNPELELLALSQNIFELLPW